MTVTWIGIDPGQSGGLSFISEHAVGAVVMPIHPKADQKMWGSPVDWMEVFTTLRSWRTKETYAVVERSQAMPKQGVSSTFKYGSSYGGLLTVLQVLQIPYHLVRPYTWKKAVLGEGETSGKESAIRYCQARWPSLSLLRNIRCRTPHDGMADALCIAAYGEQHLDATPWT